MTKRKEPHSPDDSLLSPTFLAGIDKAIGTIAMSPDDSDNTLTPLLNRLIDPAQVLADINNFTTRDAKKARRAISADAPIAPGASVSAVPAPLPAPLPAPAPIAMADASAAPAPTKPVFGYHTRSVVQGGSSERSL